MSALTVSLANIKGGVGKSTCAVHYAEWLRMKNFRTMLVDSDKQGSAASWAVWRITEAEKQAPEISRLYDKDLFVQIPALRDRYDRIVIDTRGADGAGMRAALVVSNMAIVPVRDSDFDSAALDDLLVLVSEARSINPNLRAFSFLSQIDSRRAYPTELEKYLTEIGLPPLKAVIRHRAAYARAGRGLSVFELGDTRASAEMHQLCEEIDNELQR